MSHTILSRAAALALCTSTALSYASAQTSTPHLRHATAPFVGQTLTLAVEGAVPSVPIDLYFSPESGSYATPHGLLELRRNRLLLIAHGVTDSAGNWSFDLTVPLNETLAETGAHFQALVDDSSAPSGRVWSDAVHARFLGPRVYAAYAARGGGMYFVSAVTDSVVERIDFALQDGAIAAKPVFDATYSTGAVMITQDRLLLFDPFFGGQKHVVTFAAACSSKLLTDSARELVYVLETGNPGRIHALDLATGSEIGHLDLPNAVSGSWCAGQTAAEGFVGEYDANGRTAVRHVGFEPFADLGSVAVGGSNSTGFGEIVCAAGQVFAGTAGYEVAPPHYPEGFFTRCWTSSSGLVARVTGLGRVLMDHLTAVPSADKLAAAAHRTDMPAAGLLQVPLSTVGQPTSMPIGDEAWLGDMEPDGGNVWVAAASEPAHTQVLYRVDMTSYARTVYPHSWTFGMSDMEVLRDAWDHEVWVSNKRYPPPIDIDPEILVVDELHGTSRQIALDHNAEVLHAVPLP